MGKYTHASVHEEEGNDVYEVCHVIPLLRYNYLVDLRYRSHWNMSESGNKMGTGAYCKLEPLFLYSNIAYESGRYIALGLVCIIFLLSFLHAFMGKKE